jgi:hypothetical protein
MNSVPTLPIYQPPRGKKMFKNNLEFLAASIYALETAHEAAVAAYKEEMAFWERFSHYTRTGRFPD